MWKGTLMFSTDTVITVPEVLDFGGDSLLLVEVAGQNLDSSNKKLRLHHGDVQLSFLPRAARQLGRRVFSKGQLASAQESACASRCVFRVKDPSHPHRVGKCYVTRLWSKADKVKRFYEGDAPRTLVISSRALVRCSVWGDLGAAPKGAQEWVKRLLDFTAERLVYVSDFERVDWLREYGLASVQTPEHVYEALNLGLKCYAGTQEAWVTLKALGETAYKCPVKGDGRDRFGCAQCPIKCNGLRHVVAHTVHTNV